MRSATAGDAWFPNPEISEGRTDTGTDKDSLPRPAVDEDGAMVLVGASVGRWPGRAGVVGGVLPVLGV
jgi:hypothetical protein